MARHAGDLYRIPAAAATLVTGARTSTTAPGEAQRCTVLPVLRTPACQTGRRRRRRRKAVQTVALLWLATLLGQPSAAYAQGRPWDLSLRAFTEYSDNVALDPEANQGGSELSSMGAGALLQGSYRLVQDERWTVGVSGMVFHKQWLDEATENLSVSGFAPGLSAEHRSRVYDMPVLVALGYGYRRELVGGDDFSAKHGFNAALTLAPVPRWSLGTRAAFTFKQFDDDGNLAAVTSRDGAAMRIGGFAGYRFYGTYPHLQVALDYSRDFAEGDNFDNEGVSASMSVTQPFRLGDVGLERPVTVFATLGAQYGAVRYQNFASNPERDVNSWQLDARLYASLTRNLSADLRMAHSTDESNIDAFATERTVVTFGLNYRF